MCKILLIFAAKLKSPKPHTGEPKGGDIKGSDIALYGRPISELWGATCRMGSHSVTCRPTQINAPHLNPNQIG